MKETVLGRLLDPHPHLPRKRVTIYCRPLDPGAAAAWADRQRNVVRTDSGQRAAAREAGMSQDGANAADKARGASVLRFTTVTTVTVDEPEQLRCGVKAVRNLHAGARLIMVRAYGQQAAAFSAGVGLGILLPDHVTMPRVLTDYKPNSRINAAMHPFSRAVRAGQGGKRFGKGGRLIVACCTLAHIVVCRQDLQ